MSDTFYYINEVGEQIANCLKADLKVCNYKCPYSTNERTVIIQVDEIVYQINYTLDNDCQAIVKECFCLCGSLLECTSCKVEQSCKSVLQFYLALQLFLLEFCEFAGFRFHTIHIRFNIF